MASVRRRLYLGLGAVALLLLLGVTSWWRFGQGQLQMALEPVTRSINRLAGNLGAFVRSPSLQRENDSLRRDLAELQTREVKQAVLTLENQALRELATVPKSPGWKSLGAEVIGRQEDDTGLVYLLDRGRRDGVLPGLAVVAGIKPASDDQASAPQAVLVGTVRSAGEHISTFVLTTASQSQVLADVLSPTRPRGLAAGEYNLAVRLKYIPLTELVAPGTPVVTSNLSALIPPNLLIGKVTAIERNEGEFFQSAIVSPPLPLDRFQFLSILIAS